jgi:hypothetical protein
MISIEGWNSVSSKALTSSSFVIRDGWITRHDSRSLLWRISHRHRHHFLSLYQFQNWSWINLWTTMIYELSFKWPLLFNTWITSSRFWYRNSWSSSEANVRWSLGKRIPLRQDFLSFLRFTYKKTAVSFNSKVNSAQDHLPRFLSCCVRKKEETRKGKINHHYFAGRQFIWRLQIHTLSLAVHECVYLSLLIMIQWWSWESPPSSVSRRGKYHRRVELIPSKRNQKDLRPKTSSELSQWICSKRCFFFVSHSRLWRMSTFSGFKKTRASELMDWWSRRLAINSSSLDFFLSQFGDMLVFSAASATLSCSQDTVVNHCFERMSSFL